MSRCSEIVMAMMGGAALLGLGLILGGLGRSSHQDPAAPASVLTAQRIDIVDDLGTVVAVLGGNKNGGSLSIKDRFGRTMLLIASGEDGGALLMNQSESGLPAVHLHAGQAGGMGAFCDNQGRPAMNLSAARDDRGGLSVMDTNGARIVRAGVDESGGTLETFARSGDPLVTLNATTGLHGQITTYAPGRDQLVSITATQDHQGQIYTYADEKPLIALASNDVGPTIRVFNREGKVVANVESDLDGNGVIGVWRFDGEGRTIRP